MGLTLKLSLILIINKTNLVNGKKNKEIIISSNLKNLDKESMTELKE